jgi:glutamyl-tRNA synthetase
MAALSGKPRLRFAPSPTGFLHIGGVRTALFNWLWARKTGGSFILRIEDTDRERSTPENERIIFRDLSWVGLDWDEGPDPAGGADRGASGPYRQMERLPLYAEFAEKLIARGAAYRCYCTKEELDALRKAAPKDAFRYPGTCRDRKPPFPDRPSVLRMRAPSSGAVTYKDLVFGEVSTPNTAQQDAVLMRSDGVPLYNLGAVVDDITMGITLVARGRDHMINTPIQILLYEALGHAPPAFAHLPMMLGADGQKLSKRHGAVAVGEYRERGVSPHGLLNYLVRFGWSFGDQEVFSLPDLVEKFDWERCSTSDGKYDAKKFSSIAFEHLRRGDLTSADAYAEGVLPFLEARGVSNVDRALLDKAIPLVRDRAQTWADAATALDYFFRDPPEVDEKAAKKFLIPENRARLEGFRDVLASANDFSAKALEPMATSWLAAQKIELKDIAQPVRVAVSGRAATPGLFEVLEVLGKDKTVRRMNQAIERIAPAAPA